MRQQGPWRAAEPGQSTTPRPGTVSETYECGVFPAVTLGYGNAMPNSGPRPAGFRDASQDRGLARLGHETFGHATPGRARLCTAPGRAFAGEEDGRKRSC